MVDENSKPCHPLIFGTLVVRSQFVKWNRILCLLGEYKILSSTWDSHKKGRMRMWSERSLFFQRVFIFQQILFFCWAAAAAGSGGHQPQFYFQLKVPPRKITYFLFLHFCLPSKQILLCLLAAMLVKIKHLGSSDRYTGWRNSNWRWRRQSRNHSWIGDNYEAGY